MRGHVKCNRMEKNVILCRLLIKARTFKKIQDGFLKDNVVHIPCVSELRCLVDLGKKNPPPPPFDPMEKTLSQTHLGPTNIARRREGGRVRPSHLSTTQENSEYDSLQHASPLLLWEFKATSLPPQDPGCLPRTQKHTSWLTPPALSPPTIKSTFLPGSFSLPANANKKCLKWLTFPVTEGIREGWGSLSFKCIFIGKLISDLQQGLGQLAQSLRVCREPEH